jgi:hypothetical protein
MQHTVIRDILFRRPTSASVADRPRTVDSAGIDLAGIASKKSLYQPSVMCGAVPNTPFPRRPMSDLPAVEGIHHPGVDHIRPGYSCKRLC